MELVHEFSFLKNELIDFLVFDLETTGLNNRKDRIIEMGAIKYSNGKILETFGTLINPRIPIPEQASAIHGIFDRDIEGKPFIEDTLPQFLNLVKGTYLVAHNASFDISFMKKALGRAELEVPDIPVIDTIKVAKLAWPRRKSYSQANLAAYLAINVNSAHRAEDDCRVCLEILKMAIEKLKLGGIIG